VIEAMQWDGSVESFYRIWAWACPSNDPLESPVHCDMDDETISELYIETLEGKMTAKPNDWIIKGVNGEFYPCKPDIFHKTYELVEE
jgi:hypothetical protein